MRSSKLIIGLTALTFLVSACTQDDEKKGPAPAAPILDNSNNDSHNNEGSQDSDRQSGSSVSFEDILGEDAVETDYELIKKQEDLKIAQKKKERSDLALESLVRSKLDSNYSIDKSINKSLSAQLKAAKLMSTQTDTRLIVVSINFYLFSFYKNKSKGLILDNNRELTLLKGEIRDNTVLEKRRVRTVGANFLNEDFVVSVVYLAKSNDLLALLTEQKSGAQAAVIFKLDKNTNSPHWSSNNSLKDYDLTKNLYTSYINIANFADFNTYSQELVEEANKLIKEKLDMKQQLALEIEQERQQLEQQKKEAEEKRIAEEKKKQEARELELNIVPKFTFEEVLVEATAGLESGGHIKPDLKQLDGKSFICRYETDDKSMVSNKSISRFNLLFEKSTLYYSEGLKTLRVPYALIGESNKSLAIVYLHNSFWDDAVIDNQGRLFLIRSTESRYISKVRPSLYSTEDHLEGISICYLESALKK